MLEMFRKRTEPAVEQPASDARPAEKERQNRDVPPAH